MPTAPSSGTTSQPSSPAAPALPPSAGGSLGEALAAAHLRGRGWRVLARNWRNPSDQREELDIVALDGEVLVFVEVKARASGSQVGGYDAVDRRKLRVLGRAIRAYLRQLPRPPLTWRLDIAEVELPRAACAAAAVVRIFENIPLGRQRGG